MLVRLAPLALVACTAAWAGPEDILDAADDAVRERHPDTEAPLPAGPPRSHVVYARASSGVLQLGPHSWHIPRATFDRYAGDFGTLTKLAAYGPARNEAGKVVGYKIWRIDRTGVLFDAGLRNGDVITSVNGQATTSLPEVMKAYAQNRRSERVTLQVTRRSQRRVQLRYRID